MYRMFLGCLALYFGCSFNNTAQTIPRIASSITIDGQLAEAAWKQAESQALEHVVMPFNVDTLPVSTEVRYFEDGENLNIAFIAQITNKDNVRAYYRERDVIWDDDMVGIKIDPYNDQKLAFQFFVNPLGVQSDATENTISGSESSGWDAIWYSEGKIHDDHYVVEIMIPLRNFNFPESTDPQTWAFEFVRFLPRDVTYRLSSVDIDPDNYCWVCQMEPLKGFAGLKSGSNLLLTPTIVTGQTDELNAEDQWDTSKDSQIGLDVKWSFNTDSFLNVTLNPDFSQVEADSGQLNVNDNFTLYFQEKRPFFLENSDIFETYTELLYTRNISAPNAGVKLSGRTDKHAYGIFATDDEVTTLIMPGNLSSTSIQLPHNSKNLALRYRYDVNNDLSIGSLSTIRDSDDYHNYMTAVDLRYYLGDQDSLTVQAMTSNTQYSDDILSYFDYDVEQCGEGQCADYEHFLRTPTNQSFSGSGAVINYSHLEQDWYADLEYITVDDNFRADLGFVDQVALEALDVEMGYNFYADEGQLWNKVTLELNNEIKISNDQQIIDKEIDARVIIEGVYNSRLVLSCEQAGQIGNRRDPSILALKGNTDFFDVDSCQIRGGFTPLSGLAFDGRYRSGDRVDLSNNRVAQSTNLRLSMDYFINQHFSSNIDYVIEDLSTDQGTVFEAQQINMRLAYSLDVRHSLRLSLIYTDIDYNQNNYSVAQEPRYKDLGSQLIYSYKVNPQTAVYIGYSDFSASDNFQNLERLQKSFFAKFSYAWMP